MVKVTEDNKESSAQLLDPGFGDLYIEVRRKEKRVLSDCQVMFLPDIEPSHIYFDEWQLRKRSSKRLIAYLEKKNQPLKILEIGCGNGWLSSKCAAIAGSEVTGIDVSDEEITQAKRLFKKDNLEFRLDSFDPEKFSGGKFDIILFAASIQYFPSVKTILCDALSCLSEKGEVHILDSHFYKRNEIQGAAKRTKDYYSALGYPEMAAYYFHHAIDDLDEFNWEVLANPRGIYNKFTKREPFYWIVIKH
ncbi:MAG TPA: class I SAM-dependent methyltransferase [Mucilaginibacter sp.]|jgi:ubiquinone/menaquinone biosynthesis C-methylase UbiE|nr:class I SAM-dependent methyltransferase [Mucilaginibacter sp.]